MFYLSACVAILGAVGYQYLVKRVPSTLNPIVSILAMYAAVLGLGLALLLVFPADGGFRSHVRQLSWLQLGLAIAVIMIELGFLMMYRYGWQLSTGNLVTGVVVNLMLVGVGVILLGEKMSLVNVVGVAVCILGVALVSYRP
jgi:drug/metabolite transporter (DMT)-like permease